MTDGVAHLLRFFDCSHLPRHLRRVSDEFRVVAAVLVDTGLDGPEVVAGLRKLLEAKDCFVRAAVAAKCESCGGGGRVMIDVDESDTCARCDGAGLARA